MGEPKGQRNDVDDYLKSGKLPVQGGSDFEDAARNEIWHVHAKQGETVFINKDDPRSQDIIKHDEGGRFIAVSERQFIAQGGRVGLDRYGNEYPPYKWQSHPEVPTYAQSQGAMRLPARRRDDIDIDIDVNVGGIRRRNGQFDGDGHVHSGGCGCNRNGSNRMGDGTLRYPHQRFPNDDGGWVGTPPIVEDPNWGGLGRFPGRMRYPHQHRGGADVVVGNEDFQIRVDLNRILGNRRFRR